jgi:tRNA(fMet)-specific endonuclease VapC
MSASLIDTDILSNIMRKNPKVIPAARVYLAREGGFTLSVITMYEIERGLKSRSAAKQQSAFEELCRHSRVLPVDDKVAECASSIYAHLASRGELIGDADILIAATAIVHQMGLATNNRQHFERVPGLNVECWMEASF